MVRHASELVDWYGEHKGIREFRKHTTWYLKGYPTGGAIRGRLSRSESLEELQATLSELPLAELPAENYRNKRGHTRGPQHVVLPDGWLEDPYDDFVAGAEGDSSASGG